MEEMEKMFRYITDREDVLIMLWERGLGWRVASRRCSFINDDSLEKMSLPALREYMHEDDVPVFDVFMDAMENAMNGEEGENTKGEDKAVIAVRLFAREVWQYHNVECYLEREDGKLVRMFVMVSCMDVKEVYRIRVAEKFTSDRDPELINSQAEELVAANPDKKFTVIQFDVEKFKLFVEKYGGNKATELLNFFVSSLKVICNSLQVYTRLTADVFMIITPYEDEQWIRDFIDMLDSKLLKYDGMDYKLVYGVCIIGDLSGGLRQYGDAAAMARQRIKGDALHHVAFFREEIKQSMSSDKEIEDHMEAALANREFVMYLQPKCNITDGTLVGAEALVRWIHPEKGLIPPMKFIPLFEKNGFVIKMDQYIWEEACKKIRDWLDHGITPVPISVNLSRKHLQSDCFIDVLNGLVKKYDIPKEYLEIEITETVEEDGGMDNGVSLLKNNGFTLLMDDFGSGYSSLNTLKNTQFDVIKIDRAFLQDFIGSDRGQTIVEHTIQMTRELGLDLVAEGVESKEQAEFLNDCGCNVAQGFYYAKPMETEQFDKSYFREICIRG